MAIWIEGCLYSGSVLDFEFMNFDDQEWFDEQTSTLDYLT